jgi:manganese/zinc/iron transport system substrate-binding protein
VQVEALMGPGVDPHQFKAGAGDVGRMYAAELVLYNGLHLEGKMADLFEDMGSRVKTVAVTKDLDPAKDLRSAPEGFEGSHDPHVWFDVRLWMRAADTVRDALTELDPAHAADYTANAERYRQELSALHEEVLAKAAKVPQNRRVLITAHDAFYYFGAAYGFEVRGLQGISTVADINSATVTELARFIVDRRIPVLFGETSVPDRSMLALQAAVRRDSKGSHEVRLAEKKLFSDALGEPDTPAGTYVGMVRHNIDTIVEALKP